MRRRTAAVLLLALALSGCLALGGPGTFGDDEHPMKAYSTVGIAPEGEEDRVVARLKGPLKQEGLWSDIDRIQTAKNVVMVWGTVHAHLRILQLLDEMRR